MAGQGKFGAKIVLEGADEYKNALKNIKSEQSMLRSEMKLCSSEFKGNQNSLEALTRKHEILTKQIAVQSQKADTYRSMVEKSSRAEEEAALRMEELQTAYRDASNRLEEMKQSSDAGAEALKEQEEAVEALRTEMEQAEQGYDRAARRTEGYRTSLNYAQAELRNMQHELDETGGYMEEAQRSTGGCAHSIDEYGRETRDASEQTSVFGDVLKAELLSGAIRDGIHLLADGIRTIAEAAVDTGSSFEASMSQVAATMGMTAEEVNSGCESYTLLADAAKECGKTTMFSASEAAEALNYLALAGYDAEKAAATLPKVLDLAAAGGLDLAYASDLVTDSMAALGLETDQLDRYIDEMAKTSQKSNTSVQQLGEATLVCAGTASLAGQGLESMNTELGVLANNGIKGAEGGTHYRNVILSLVSPTEKASIALNELGVKTADSSGNMRDLNDILTDMDASMAGMASEEKTQMISRIFNKTDIAAVNALLKGTGEEYDSLNAEIRDCSGAAAAMAETLNNNLKGKVTILQSALEGLGISAYEIFDGDLKKAVDAATGAVGRLQRSIDSGALGVSLNRLSESVGEFAENAISAGEDALPVMIDGLTWLIDHADLLISGLTGIAAANLQMKVVAPAVEAVSAAWNAYKIANEGATVSQWLLNTAMNANPAGILITTITALTAAVGAYILIHKDEAGVMDDTTRATQELLEKSKDLNEVYGKAAGSRKESRENMEAEAHNCQKLAGELKKLQAKTELTATEQVRQKMIVDELNQAIPELNLSIDEQTGKLNMSTKALEENVEAMMAMARADAAREDMIRIAEEQYEAEKNLADLEEQLAEQKKAVKKAQEELNASIEENGMMGVVEAQVLEQAAAGQKALEEEIDATRESIDAFTAEYEEAMVYVSETEALADAAAATEELGDAAGEVGNRLTGMSEEAQAAFAEMYEAVSETVSSQMSLFEEFDGKAELTTEKLLENMQSQVDGITQWSDNMRDLAERGIDQGLLQKLADMGPEGAGYVATFVSMTDEELQRANDLFEQSLTLPDAVASSVADSYVTAGEMAAEGFISGVEENEKQIEETVSGAMETGVEAAREAWQTHSPSKVTEEIGQNVVEGFIAGIQAGSASMTEVLDLICQDMVQKTMVTMDRAVFEEIGETIDLGLQTGLQAGRNDLMAAMETICTGVVKQAKQSLPKSTFHAIGLDVTEGLATGILAGKSRVVNAIVEVCTSAIRAAKKELDIASPSKKFAYMGRMSAEGYMEGWKRQMADIDAVIRQSLPETSIKPVKNGSYEMYMPEWEAGIKKQYINQEVHIHSMTDDLIETSRKFEESMREAARGW